MPQRRGLLRPLVGPPRRGALALECPDDGELSRFLDRTLSHVRVRALEEHFDRCRECRELAYALAAVDSPLETGDEPA